MEFIFFAGGVILGTILTAIFKSKESIHGVIEVDHRTEQCIFRLTSDELQNPKNKKAVFSINHNANISREEQSL